MSSIVIESLKSFAVNEVARGLSWFVCMYFSLKIFRTIFCNDRCQDFTSKFSICLGCIGLFAVSASSVQIYNASRVFLKYVFPVSIIDIKGLNRKVNLLH